MIALAEPPPPCPQDPDWPSDFMTSRNHSYLQGKIYSLLQPYQDRIETFQQISLRLDGWASIPDISLFPAGLLSHDVLDDEEEITRPPITAIEIQSPQQAPQPLVRKIQRYLAHGVASAWLVVPVTRAITLFQPGAAPRTFTLGQTLADPASGVEIPLDQIFP